MALAARPWTCGILAGKNYWAQRRPMLLFLFVGSFLLRFEVRRFLGLLFHEPPRRTLLLAFPPFVTYFFLAFLAQPSAEQAANLRHLARRVLVLIESH